MIHALPRNFIFLLTVATALLLAVATTTNAQQQEPARTQPATQQPVTTQKPPPTQKQAPAQQPATAPQPAAAQEAEQEQEAEPENEDDLTRARQQLLEIQQSILVKRSQVSDLRRQLKRTTDESERHEMELKIEDDETDLKNLRTSFENIALGGLDLSIFDPQQQNMQFNWQQELQAILKPVFQALKQITEKPRQIEHLSSQISVLEAQTRIAQTALANINKLFDDSLDKVTRERLESVRKSWSQQADDLQRQRGISELQLKVMKDNDENILARLHQSLSDFFTGRGLNMALAVGAFLLVYFAMKGLYSRYITSGSGPFSRYLTNNTSRRIFKYIYQAVTLIFSIIAVLLMLYMVDDILLLVLAVIVLLVLGLGMRNFLPRYIQEAKLLMNLGAVRERERVIYRDLPWMVRSLGVFSKLYNPALDGLLRLPLSEILTLVSRPYREDEPWFPTATGDWVMMGDETVGQVTLQTPEIVQIRTKGSVQSRVTASFLASQPRNLSAGFSVPITFGIDYQHQDISTTEVEKVLKQAIETALRLTEIGKHVEDVLVEFKDAGASSLNYLIYITMKGSGAEYYFAVTRLVQKICVDICNEHGWIIPFNQLTIHAGSAGAEVVEDLKG